MEFIYIAIIEETEDAICGVSTSLQGAFDLVKNCAQEWMWEDIAEYPIITDDTLASFIKQHDGHVMQLPTDTQMWWRSKDGAPTEATNIPWR